MYCKTILGQRGGRIFTIAPGATLAEAARLMSEHRIGALLVLQGDGHLIGILSERDLTRALSRHREAAATLRVSDFMTADVATCSLDDHLDDVMELMNRRHVRHLPVVEDGRPVGMVSIRDVVERLLEETATERDMIREYVAAAAC